MSVSVLVYVGLMYGAIGSTCTDISCEKEWNVILKYLFYDMHWKCSLFVIVWMYKV